MVPFAIICRTYYNHQAAKTISSYNVGVRNQTLGKSSFLGLVLWLWPSMVFDRRAERNTKTADWTLQNNSEAQCGEFCGLDWFIDGIYVVSKIIEAAGNLVIAGVLRPSYITHGSKMTFFDLKQFHRVFWDLNSTPLKCDVKNRHWFHLFWFRLYLKALACFFLENNFCYHKLKRKNSLCEWRDILDIVLRIDL